ncbi:phosphatase PAP2 family protein [Sphingobium sp. HBC34]|uniref:Phosphatase PAP2 family protein n=1 Tax=Sphingobium cyanobacteriorum TaxID=3063954 RepID=A0ABT8ZL16_9SPHN|nr:phosphatase PAP2 family protein [Sphingobium sp. HBC34]MDO7835053.1 phosphatase PAP2 family protein [Sphingobium sp. HBC34]
MTSTKKIPPEIGISLAMVAAMLLFSAWYDLPIIFPAGERAAYVGVHYLYPLIGVGIWGAFAFFGQKKALARTFLIALPCYVAVLFAHFNIKLWIPHVNPLLYDELYWSIDQLFRPLVDMCMVIRRMMATVIPYEANFYMIGYIAMFYCSFCYHAVRTPTVFSELVIAALLLQVIGTLAYLVAPAVGPFIYEQGLDPMVTPGQMSMLDFYRHSVAEGPAWLERNGAVAFTVGLAAMPSLHTAAACLFLGFAWRHGRILLPLYIFLTFFIMVTAIATRWHYLIDLPVGVLIAWVSLAIARKLTASAGDKEPVAVPANLQPEPA